MQRKERPHDLDVGRRKGDSLGSHEHNHPPHPCMSLSLSSHSGKLYSLFSSRIGRSNAEPTRANRTGTQMHHPKVTQRTGRALGIDLNPSFTNSAHFIMEYFQHTEKYRK